jgi:hypothetical protein
VASQDILNSKELISRSGKLLMAFASAVILCSDSCRTPDYIFLSHDSGVVRMELVSSLVMSNEEVECGPLQFRLIGVLIPREKSVRIHSGVTI